MDHSDEISDEELDEALSWLDERGELDYLLEPCMRPAVQEEQDAAAVVAEFFERNGDDLADLRVAHAARRAVGLVRNMVGAISDRGSSASGLVDTVTQRIEIGIDHAYLQLNQAHAA